jgi:hypothetical protein
LDEALVVLVAQVIIPHSGWDRKKPGPTHWTALLRNASGILRFVEFPHLILSILFGFLFLVTLLFICLFICASIET